MKKKLSINEVCMKHGFTKDEADMFYKCLNKAKEEQEGDSIVDLEKEFLSIIEGGNLYDI